MNGVVPAQVVAEQQKGRAEMVMNLAELLDMVGGRAIVDPSRLFPREEKASFLNGEEAIIMECTLHS